MDYDTAVESYLMIWLFNNNKTRIAQTAVVISVRINQFLLFIYINTVKVKLKKKIHHLHLAADLWSYVVSLHCSEPFSQ